MLRNVKKCDNIDVIVIGTTGMGAIEEIYTPREVLLMMLFTMHIVQYSQFVDLILAL